MKLKTDSLEENYNLICNMYAHKFAVKHELPFDAWVADKVGEVATMGDYSVDFREIKYDIDNDIDADEYDKYYDYCLEVGMLNLTAPNYESWCKGCPRIPQEIVDKIRKQRYELNTLIKETEELYGSN